MLYKLKVFACICQSNVTHLLFKSRRTDFAEFERLVSCAAEQASATILMQDYFSLQHCQPVNSARL